jgi:UDP-N-acetylglucosamine 2-epimerase
MRVVSIVGARPQFVKVAPISWITKDVCEHLILHTGQHYDHALSDAFFADLDIPKPVETFNVGSGSHAEQTAGILVKSEAALIRLKPDVVLIYGDTNSTLAGVLAASKLGIKTGHIEAGLRSFNRSMPEEINRVVSDHLSDILFAPTNTAVENLKKEGLGNKTLLVGDIFIESFNYIVNKIRKSEDLVRKPYLFTTIHRAENTDKVERLEKIISKLAISKMPIHLYAHPRLIKQAKLFNIKLNQGSIIVYEPATYLETDSGGLQKEAYLSKTPCLTIREETEWLETLNGGWNKLDPNLELITSNWWELTGEYDPYKIFGDGSTSKKILNSILTI